jgi:hypothetical protein
VKKEFLISELMMGKRLFFSRARERSFNVFQEEQMGERDIVYTIPLL